MLSTTVVVKNYHYLSIFHLWRRSHFPTNGTANKAAANLNEARFSISGDVRTMVQVAKMTLSQLATSPSSRRASSLADRDNQQVKEPV